MMDYKEETVEYTVDVLKVDKDSLDRMNEIFDKVIKKKFSVSHDEKLSVDKVILISGIYRAELKIKPEEEEDIVNHAHQSDSQ